MNYDLKRAAELIEEQTCYKGRDAENLASRIPNLHPSLKVCVEAWLEGKEPNYIFEDISLSYIRKKENTPYILALFTLSTLMKHPELIGTYIEMEYYLK